MQDNYRTILPGWFGVELFHNSNCILRKFLTDPPSLGIHNFLDNQKVSLYFVLLQVVRFAKYPTKNNTSSRQFNDMKVTKIAWEINNHCLQPLLLYQSFTAQFS